jgi:energy-coupling factor transporter ATP-binding protein EcfA2
MDAHMEQSALRTLTTQLAEDFSWLESHAASHANTEMHVGALRYAAATVRNVIAPFLEGQQAAPLHVCVVGGAGAGKSTIANLLMGAMQAESNPQAGYTRHPIAFIKSDAAFTWPSSLGFLGPLKKLPNQEPARLDEDVYQIRRIHADRIRSRSFDNFAVLVSFFSFVFLRVFFGFCVSYSLVFIFLFLLLLLGGGFCLYFVFSLVLLGPLFLCLSFVPSRFLLSFLSVRFFFRGFLGCFLFFLFSFSFILYPLVVFFFLGFLLVSVFVFRGSSSLVFSVLFSCFHFLLCYLVSSALCFHLRGFLVVLSSLFFAVGFVVLSYLRVPPILGFLSSCFSLFLIGLVLLSRFFFLLVLWFYLGLLHLAIFFSPFFFFLFSLGFSSWFPARVFVFWCSFHFCFLGLVFFFSGFFLLSFFFFFLFLFFFVISFCSRVSFLWSVLFWDLPQT